MVSDTQRYSNLLSLEENKEVVSLLGERCQPLVMSVVQVFQTGAPDHGSWRKRDSGVLVLVKDNARRSYFFRLYCLSRRQLVWEHEVYSNMEYNTPRSFFHMFEAEDCVTAFNFADEKEANDLNKILKENMAARQRRRQERKRQASQNTNVSNHLSSQHSVSTPMLSNGSVRSSAHHRTAKGKDKQRQAEKKKISKADIGHPQDFRHVSHVGWNPNTGFDFTDEAEGSAMKQFFEKAGVSETQLQDKNTRDFIYDFIKNHGGIDRVKDEVQSPDVPLQSPDVPPPPVPARTVQSSASIRTAPPPPPPPSRNPLPPPPPPSQAAAMAPAPGPPPPPPLRTLPQRQDPTRGGPAPTPPPPPPMQNAVGVPAPPPPPPPMSASASASAPAPPVAPLAPAAPVAPAAPDLRSALMDAIRNGKALKPVTLEEKSRNGTGGDSRAELMDQIRQGKELRTVSTSSLEELDIDAGAFRISLDQSSAGSFSSIMTVDSNNFDEGFDLVDNNLLSDNGDSFESHFDSSDSPSKATTSEHIYVNIDHHLVTDYSTELITRTNEIPNTDAIEREDTVTTVSYTWKPPKKTPLFLKLLKMVVYAVMQVGVIWLFHWNLLFLFPYPTSVIVLIMSLGLFCALLLSLSLIPKTCYY